MAQEVIEVTEREIEIIEVIERGPVGPTGPQPDINYEVVSSARTLEAADLIAADTSGGAFTLTLPANPSNGDAVDIFDFSETFDTNPLTIARNGQPIESLNEDLVANVEGAYFTLIYTGATRGWQVLPRYGGGGGSGGELTTEGDILYRGPVVNTRLGIGTAGQILKVNSTATAPEWGAAPDSIDDYTVVTTSQTLTNGARIAADTTSGSFTLTLPSAPQGGDTVYILDYAQTFDTNNLILARNGSNIEGLAEDMTCNVEGSSFKMVFTGASTGWQMIPYYGTGVAIGSNATDVLSLSSGQIVADDPAADRLVFWDDSESKLTYLQAGSGLTISGTTISASGGDTVTIDASAADILSATSGAISADDAGSDKIVFWDDSESKLAYGSVGDVGAAAASHTHIPSEVGLGNVSNVAQVTSVGGTGPIVSSGGTTPTISVTIGTTAGTVAAGDHTHGNLTNDGKLGSTAGLPVVTATAGAVTTLALGTANQVLRVNSGATGVEFADPASGVTGAAASASDVLGVSGSDITGVDAGSADRIVFWDDSASALKYLEAGSGLSISGTTMTVTATGGATNLWIPASAFIPKTTAGCGVDSRETATNDQNFDELLFDAGSDEFADALVVMPSNYNNGTITARFYWTAASGSGGVAWAIQGRALANDDALDTAAGTAQLVTDTLIAADDMHVTSATSAVTIGGTPAANTPIQFTIYRDVSDAADDLAVDARLLGVEIIFN